LGLTQREPKGSAPLQQTSLSIWKYSSSSGPSKCVIRLLHHYVLSYAAGTVVAKSTLQI